MAWSDIFGSVKGRLTLVVAAMAVSLGLFAAPASAQQQEGLVNVYIADIDVMAQVPIGVAANVCGVNVAALATGEQVADPVCTAETEQFTLGQQRAFGMESNGNGDPQQQGLVNVWISDIDVMAQVPIGVAANVCGLNVAVLAQGEQTAEPVCEAETFQFTRGQQQAFGIS